MKTNITHEFFFTQPPEAVWEYLTKPELIEQWLMKNDFELMVGHSFQFRSSPAPAIGFDGNVYCRVLEIVPMKKLAYSWKCGPGDGRFTIDSLVEWKLNPKDGGTELLLVHSGFRETDNFSIIEAMREGWRKNIIKISEKLKISEHGATQA